MRPILLSLRAAFVVGTLGLLAACDSEIQPEGGAAKAKPAPTAGPGDDLPSRGSTSTLGKAKESAQHTVDKLEERQREIERQLEGEGGGG